MFSTISVVQRYTAGSADSAGTSSDAVSSTTTDSFLMISFLPQAPRPHPTDGRVSDPAVGTEPVAARQSASRYLAAARAKGTAAQA
jgi:hypothetical protein